MGRGGHSLPPRGRAQTSPNPAAELPPMSGAGEWEDLLYSLLGEWATMNELGGGSAGQCSGRAPLRPCTLHVIPQAEWTPAAQPRL